MPRITRMFRILLVIRITSHWIVTVIGGKEIGSSKYGEVIGVIECPVGV